MPDDNSAPISKPKGGNINIAPYFHEVMQCWIVTRYEDAVQILGDPENFSSQAAYAVKLDESKCPADVIAKMEAIWPLDTRQLVALDRPDHTKFRSLITHLFARNKINDYEPRLTAIANDLADKIVPGEQTDLMTAFIIPYSLRSVLGVIGFDATQSLEIETRIATASLLFFVQMDEAGARQSGDALITIQNYVDRLVQQRTAQRQQDMVSHLLDINETYQSPLSRNEINQFFLDLVFAGNDPVKAVLSSFILRLLASGNSWEKAAKQPSSIVSYLEEAARLTSGLRGIARHVMTDVEICGVKLPAGATVLVMPSAANRDPSVFEEPAQVDPSRWNIKQHIGYGFGSHYCVGAPLGRLELQIGLIALLSKFPGMRLLGNNSVAFAKGPMMAQIMRLPVLL